MSESTKRQTSGHRTMGILPKVVEYLSRHPGETMYRKDLAQTLGFSEAQVMNCITAMRTRHPMGPDIEIVSRGSIWVYRPGSKPPAPADKPKRLFEEIGATKDGAVILEEADSGTLWKAVEL